MSQVGQGLRKKSRLKKKKKKSDRYGKPESAKTGLGSGGHWGHRWLCLQEKGGLLGGQGRPRFPPRVESKRIMLRCPGRSSLSSCVAHNLNFKSDHLRASL